VPRTSAGRCAGGMCDYSIDAAGARVTFPSVPMAGNHACGMKAIEVALRDSVDCLLSAVAVRS